MKGGHGDQYYRWLCEYIRAYRAGEDCPVLVEPLRKQSRAGSAAFPAVNLCSGRLLRTDSEYRIPKNQHHRISLFPENKGGSHMKTMRGKRIRQLA